MNPGEASPEVSVVMPVLDPEPRFFLPAVESLIDQSFEDWELLVLETPGSSSGAGLLALFEDERIRHVLVDASLSLPRVLNRGFEMARGRLLARFDSDDICEKDRLLRQKAFLDAHPEIGILGTRISVIDEEGRDLGLRPYPLDHDSIYRALSLYNPMAHPSVMLRRETWEVHGGYNPREGSVCEDYELWSRLANEGVRFANLEEPLLRYRLHRKAMKARRLRDSLTDTLWIKKTYWKGRLGFRGRLRFQAEKLALLLPPPLVMALFSRFHFRKR